MARYTIIITTHEDRRLHFRTDNDIFIVFMHKCATDGLDANIAKSLTSDELTMVEAYLDHPISCKVIDNLTKQSVFLPV